jgi:hypothetical protein
MKQDEFDFIDPYGIKSRTQRTEYPFPLKLRVPAKPPSNSFIIDE